MKTKIKALDPETENLEIIEEAAERLKKGEPIIFPTETVYGLAALYSSENALEKIYKIKGRDFNKTLPVMISRTKMLSKIVQNISDSAQKLIDKFWPGPLTIIFQAKPGLSQWITSETQTIGIRLPSHPIPLAVIDAIHEPLAVTSANLSGKPSPKTAEDALEQLKGKIPLILDGGRSNIGLESTIVSCEKKEIKILRIGAVSEKDIQKALS